MSLDVWLTQEGEGNITHSLGRMAAEAGIYECLWHPHEHSLTHAEQLVPLLADGLVLLEADPIRFRAHNAPNGWGRYEGFLEFVKEYLAACRKYPHAEIGVSL